MNTDPLKVPPVIGSQTPPIMASPQPPTVIIINQTPVKTWSRGVAAILSFLIPGLGQAYKGQILNGIAWFVIVAIGYVSLVFPGLILHVFCVIGALSGNQNQQTNTTVYRQ
jgi:TM2 domain-containing membrane protein YozV